MKFMEDVVGAVGFEEGRAWLPTHVLGDEAFEPTLTKQQKNLWPQQERPQRYHHGGKDPSIRTDISRNQHYKSSSRPPPRPRYQRGRASGGPGMQAIFIEPSHKPCGTGFFLPLKLGNNNNFQMSKKPACSPVLLPSRVIQALNLNVHALGTQITAPRRDPENHLRSTIQDSTTNKRGNDRSESIVTAQTCVASVSLRSSSPEIYLPKEWTY